MNRHGTGLKTSQDCTNDQLAFADTLNIYVVWHGISVCIFTGIQVCKGFALKISKVCGMELD